MMLSNGLNQTARVCLLWVACGTGCADSNLENNPQALETRASPIKAAERIAPEDALDEAVQPVEAAQSAVEITEDVMDDDLALEPTTSEGRDFDHLVVSTEMMALLAEAPEGVPLIELDDSDEMRDLYERVLDDAPAPEAPIAVCTDLVLHADSEGCVEIEPERLAANSYSPVEQPFSLTSEVEVLCGAGNHIVDVYAEDDEGQGTRCQAKITLCGDGDTPRICDPDAFPPAAPAPTPKSAPPAPPACTCRLVTTPINLSSAYSDGARYMHYVDIERSYTGPIVEMEQSDKYRNCQEDNRALAGSISADAQFSIYIQCTNAQGAPCKRPKQCGGKAHLYTLYRSKGAATTKLGGRCPRWDWAPKARAYAQEEVTLVVGGKPRFQKGFSLQTGNEVAISDTLSGAAKAGKNKDGASAELGVTFGTTVLNDGKEGSFVRETNAHWTDSVPLSDKPVTVRLSVEATTQLLTKNVGASLAQIDTRHWLTLAHIESTCPGFSTATIGRAGGRLQTNKYRADEATANSWLQILNPQRTFRSGRVQ